MNKAIVGSEFTYAREKQIIIKIRKNTVITQKECGKIIVWDLNGLQVVLNNRKYYE